MLTYYAQDPGLDLQFRKEKVSNANTSRQECGHCQCAESEETELMVQRCKASRYVLQSLVFSMDFIGHNSLRNIKFKRWEGQDEYMDDLDANDGFTSAYSLPNSHQD